MRQRLSAALTRFVSHPYTRLFVGTALIASGVDDLIDNLGVEAWWELGVHHGVIAFGVYKALGAVADVLHGMETVVEHEH